MQNMTYLPCIVDWTPKSPVELQRLLRLECTVLGCGDGEGAGDTELLLGESECNEVFDWWIDFVLLQQKKNKRNFKDYGLIFLSFSYLRFKVPMPIVWRRECSSAELVVPLDALPEFTGRGFLSFQSVVVLLLIVEDELFGVGLCDVTIW